MNKIEITKVDNGFIVNGPHPNADGDITSVYEEPEGIEEDSEEFLTAEKDMLYEVKNLLGLYGSKHDKYRLVINIVKQPD